jgi:NADPH:quinone reductase-like Zn-dependent oxidoreductase
VWYDHETNGCIPTHKVSRKHIDYTFLAVKGATVGCDFTGTVVALGPKVTKGYKAGDRIAGVTHGSNASNLEDGCFAEYCIVKEGATFRVPDSMSAEKAATVGVALTTVALALYQNLDMPFPGTKAPSSEDWVLIYGGSTACGSMAIQSAFL